MSRHKVLNSPRLARRKRKEKKIKIAVLAILTVVIVGATLYAVSLPHLLIQRVELIGDSPVPEEDILSIVTSQLAGRSALVFPRASAFFFPSSATEKVLLTRFPVLQSVDISTKNFASLFVSVASREAVALWCVPPELLSENCAVVDRTGFAFEVLSPEESQRYPRISDFSATSSVSLSVVAVSEPRLTSLLSLLRRLEEFSLEASEVELYGGGEMAVLLANGGKILLREDGEFTSELDRLGALLSEQNLVPRNGGGVRVDYIDLRYGNKIYFKPR